MTLEGPGPFKINVFDADRNFLFRLGDASVSITMRHLAKGTGTISVPLMHVRANALLREGTRVTVDYLVGADASTPTSWVRVMSGALWSVQTPDDSSVPTVGKTLEFGIEDDTRMLWGMTGFPVPTNSVDNQSTAAYWTETGFSEDVVKDLVTANATRLGIPLTVEPSQSRGSTVTENMRFGSVGDAAVALLGADGLGFTVYQAPDDSGYVMSVYQPQDRTARVLSESAGSITSWSFTRTGPSATRAIVGGAGAGTSRDFTEVFDISGLEDAWGQVAEVFVDARDTSDHATYVQRGLQALSDGRPQAGFSVTVAETPVVKAMVNLLAGDLVRVQVTPAIQLTDVLSQMTISYDTTDGLTIAPQVGSGDSTAHPNTLFAKALSSVARGLRYLRSTV